MYGFTQSFNVSVAAGICLYQLKQKLLDQKIPHFLDEEKRMELKIRWTLKSIKEGEKILKKYLENASKK